MSKHPRNISSGGVLAYCTRDRRTVGVHRRGPGPDPARMKGLQAPAIRQNAQSSRPGKPGRLTGDPVIEKGTSTTSWSPSSLRKEERSAEGRRFQVTADCTSTLTIQRSNTIPGREGLPWDSSSLILAVGASIYHSRADLSKPGSIFFMGNHASSLIRKATAPARL